MYFVDPKFLLIVIHVKHKYVFIFHITKKYVSFAVFDMNFLRKPLLCPFSYKTKDITRMSSCAIMSLSCLIPNVLHKPRKTEPLFKKLDVLLTLILYNIYSKGKLILNEVLNG